MKKNLFLYVILFFVSAGYTQTKRTILYEEFSGEDCNPCAFSNPYITSTIHATGNYPDKIVFVKYQCNVPTAPGPGSLFQDDPSEVSTRGYYYYSLNLAPYARFNGIELPDVTGTGNNGDGDLITQQYINDSSIVNSLFAIDMSYFFNAAQDSITLTTIITAAQNYTATTSNALVLQIAMEESFIHFNSPPGTNGEIDFHDVMRKMIPNASGTILNNVWANTNVQTIIQKIKIPSYIKNKNQICFVGWVQDNGTKRVHNAAYAKLDVNMGATAISGVLPYNCNSTFNPIVTVKNFGANTINTYILAYAIDANPIQYIAGTGTPLVAGNSTPVSLPSQTFTPGNHKIVCSTSMPNGSADMFAADDSFTFEFVVFASPVVGPISEDFESSIFPPTNWGILRTGDQSLNWDTTSHGGYLTSTKSIFLENWINHKSNTNEIILPAISFVGQTLAQMTFDIAKAPVPSSWKQSDRLKVQTSVDCGSSWVTVYDKEDSTGTLPTTVAHGSEYFPNNAADWRTDVINLNFLAGEANVLIKFLGISDNGNNLFLDNINVTNTNNIQEQAAFTSVKLYPDPASNEINLEISFDKTESVTIKIYNNLGEQIVSENKKLNTGANKVKLNTEDLTNGIYFISLTSSKESITQKVIISK
jgi:hypothetical protein